LPSRTHALNRPLPSPPKCTATFAFLFRERAKAGRTPLDLPQLSKWTSAQE
jgi:hypothetical protein